MSTHPERGEKQQINLQIVERMNRILEERDTFFISRMLRLRSVNDPNLLATLSLSNEKMPFPIPKDFSDLPIYIFVTWDLKHRDLFSTPYGEQEQYAIGSDNSLYGFANVFLFNKQGKGVKFEAVQHLTPADDEYLANIDREKVVKLDFTPEEKTSRYVDLKPEDYEHILFVLGEIEAHRIIPRLY